MPRGGPGSDRGSYYPLPSDLDQDATRRGGPAGGTPPVQSLWAALVDPSHDGALSIGQDNTRLMVHIDDVGHARSLSLHKRHLVRDRLVRYRDSLLLDPTVPIPFPAALFIREKAIIVNLEAVRMIICANQCYVLSVPKEGAMASAVLPTPTDPFIRHLCAALTPGSHTTSPSTPNFASYTGGVHTHASPASFDPDHGWDPDMPYELRALEVALTAVTHTLDLEAFEIERAGYPAAQRMSREVTNESLEEIAALKDRLGRLTGRTTRVKAEFEKILGDDADLADLYLTRRAEESGVPLPPQPPGSRPASAGSQGGTEDGSSSSVRVPSAGTEGSTGPEGAASRRAALYRKTSLVMRQVKPSTSLTKRQSSSFDGVSEGEASAAVAAVVEVDKPIKEEPEEEEEEEEVIITHPFGAAAFIDPRDIEAAEDLLETAFIQTNHILQRLNLLSERISSAELLVRIAMDRRRNELTALELWVTNISMGFAYVSAVGGIFGMNLWNSVYQESKPVFLWVIFACVVGFVGLPASLIIYMRKRRLDFIAERSM